MSSRKPITSRKNNSPSSQFSGAYNPLHNITYSCSGKQKSFFSGGGQIFPSYATPHLDSIDKTNPDD
jgi:hypothetical protein